MSPIDMEPLWRQLEVYEADLARLKKLGGDKEVGWDEANEIVARFRATIKEMQRADRAKLPEEQFRTDKRQLRQEDADWIEARRGDKG
jgi:hypothetical protein